MAHSFYQSEEDLPLDPQPTREALSFPRTVRHGNHRWGMERRASCVSSAELDSKSRNPARRRIQVAVSPTFTCRCLLTDQCNRCRKRKIKCSGDTGDGQGCSNCRSSGNTDCHFLRVSHRYAVVDAKLTVCKVNSSVLQTKVSGWPYPVVNATMSPHRMGTYTSKRSAVPVNQNVRAASFSRPVVYDGLFDQSVFEQPSFSVEQGINYGEGSAYQYMMSSLPDYSGMWEQKAWTPKQNGTMFPDQQDNSLTQSTFPYMLPPGTPPTEIPAVAPTMTLRSDGSQTGRTLPNPASRQVPSSMSAVPSTPDTVPTIAFTQDFRFGNPWGPRATAPNPRTLMSMPNGPFTTPMTRIKLNTSTAGQDMAFGYLPVNSATTTGPAPAIPSSTATVPGIEPADAGNAERRLSRSFSRDNGRVLGLGDCAPEIYGYSTSEKSKNQASDSEAGDSGSATLLNGLPYTRVRHPETNSALTFNLLQTNPIPEYRPPAEAQRTVSPLGSNGF